MSYWWRSRHRMLVQTQDAGTIYTQLLQVVTWKVDLERQSRFTNLIPVFYSNLRRSGTQHPCGYHVWERQTFLTSLQPGTGNDLQNRNGKVIGLCGVQNVEFLIKWQIYWISNNMTFVIIVTWLNWHDFGSAMNGFWQEISICFQGDVLENS